MKETDIQWADSSLNLMMGCNGCELWTTKERRCYAGILTRRYGGGKGWPAAFEQPAMFPERLAPALKWPDLTGKDRPNKPWLDGYPRTIFLDDMGDTFTEGLALDWLMPHIEAMAQSPHIWQFLTKRPRRMAQFFRQLGYVPTNFWLGTTITSSATLKRLDALLSIDHDKLWLSIEPLLGPLVLPLGAMSGWCGHPCDDYLTSGFCPCTAHPRGGSGPHNRVSWVVIGGESGSDARPTNLSWVEALIAQCQNEGAAIFVKQLGSSPVRADGSLLKLKDSKGGDMAEWPARLAIRQMMVSTQLNVPFAAGQGVLL